MSDLIESIAATAELCGTALSPAAARMLVGDLSEYPEAQVLPALAKCRKELKGRLTLAEILNRIDDGRPGAEEAWAALVWDEQLTAVLTSEMNEAQGAAYALYDYDKVGARMAFKEAYTRLLSEARAERRPVRWLVSEGWDKAGREEPVKRALAAGKITLAIARRIVPELEAPTERRALESGQAALPEGSPMPDDVRKQIADLAAKKSLPGKFDK